MKTRLTQPQASNPTFSTALMRWLRRWWPLLYLSLATAVLYAAFHRWTYDDPFITYRYADNLWRGLGFVYNAGQRVLSTTTPLFTLLLAPLAFLGPNLFYAANLIGALSLAAGGLCLWGLGRTWQTLWIRWVGLLVYPIYPLLLATTGSETALYLALCLGAFAAYARQRFRLAALMAALALLTRADGVLVALVLALDYALNWLRQPQGISRDRSVPLGAAGVYLAVALPWFIFATWYFGSPLPATLVAKQHQGSLAVSMRFAPGFINMVRTAYAPHWHYLLQAGLAAAGAIYGLLRARRWGLIWLWGVLYFAGYTLLGVSRYFWYYAPLVPSWLVAVGLGLEAMRWLAGQSHGLRRSAVSGLSWALCLLLAARQGLDADHLRRSPDMRFGLYRAVGEHIDATLPEQASVGLLEVGIIGYYARRPIVDFAGLIQPAVAQQLTAATTYQDAARWALQAYRPEYLVLNPAWFPGLLQEQVLPHCATENTFAGEPYGSPDALVVYHCRWP